MRPLNFEENRRALSTIAPSPIPYSNMDYLEFYKGFNDLAQGNILIFNLICVKYFLKKAIY